MPHYICFMKAGLRPHPPGPIPAGCLASGAREAFSGGKKAFGFFVDTIRGGENLERWIYPERRRAILAQVERSGSGGEYTQGTVLDLSLRDCTIERLLLQ